MEAKAAHPKDSIEYILQSILVNISQDKRANVRDTSVAREPTEIYASAEEGARLIRAFIRIKQPELRAAIIELATQISTLGHLRS
jgi:hypothetical protein